MSFYKTSDALGRKPVALSLVEPFSHLVTPKSRLIPTMHDLFNTEYVIFEYQQVIKRCSEIDMSISDNDVDIIEKDTRSQSIGNAFFRLRAGRIGASVSKQASHTNPNTS